MKRRDFIAFAGAGVALPLAARAQQKAMPVIGYLGLASPTAFATQLSAFQQGLAAHGFVEGDNVKIEYRWAGGYPTRLPALAEDLVRTGVNVIATSGGPRPALAAAAATDTIPIVASSAAAIVDSLARPQRNLTGAGTQTTELNPKRLELLHAAVPQAAIVAVLDNPAASRSAEVAAATTGAVVDAASSLGVRIVTANADKENELDGAFAKLENSRPGALLVMASPFLFAQHPKIIAFANRSRLPAIYEWAEIARNGGLMAYGDSSVALYRRSGDYVGRVLKGAKPTDLPIDLPPAIRLTINLKAAKEIGFDFPSTIRDRADEVIE